MKTAERSRRQRLWGSRRVHAGSGGISLMEVLLVIAILGLVAGPLSMVFVSFMRGHGKATDTFSRSAEAQRIGEAWTRDVQSVEPGGVNGEVCQSIDPGNDTSDETQRVSFNWDVAAQAGGASTVKRTATWVVKRVVDDKYSLIRRYCEDSLPKEERVLATNLHADGIAPALLVRGPGSPVNEFCPADPDGARRTCTIRVGGGYDYELTVTRRAPDFSGVAVPLPLESPQCTGYDARNGYINLYWDPPPVGAGQSAIEKYSVVVHEGSADGPVVKNLTVDADGTGGQAFMIDGLVNGTEYYVALRAQNGQGFGDETFPRCGPYTPLPTVPEAPTITGVTALDTGEVVVTWSHHANDGGSAVNSWSIWAFKEGADPDNLANLIGPTRPSPDGPGTSGTVTGLDRFTRYQFIVADHNAVGEGFRSAPSSPVMPYSSTIFVRSSNGSDSAGCGSISSPCRTVDYAQGRATGLSNPVVALAGGMSYSRFSLKGSNTVMGGFSSDFTSASCACESTINDGAFAGSGASGRSAIDVYNVSEPAAVRNVTVSRSNAGAGVTTSGIDIYNSASVTLERVTVTNGVGADPTGVRIRSSVVNILRSNVSSGAVVGPGVSAYGVRALDASTVTITDSQVVASHGSSGSSAAGQGSSGAAGAAGNGGGSVTDGSCNGGGGGAPATNGSWGRAGGTGGTGGCGNTSGDGGSAGTSSGHGNHGGGGGSGSGNIVCVNASGGGSGGGATNPSGNASVGGAGGTITMPNGHTFVVSSGGAGNAGAHGHGGGGGGGGGGHRSGSWTACNDTDRGGGGGAGGQGGQGGQGGVTGGGGGGGSFGVYAIGSTVSILETAGQTATVTAGNGGTGGTGQKGGDGGRGGDGGAGGAANGNTDAGPGGRGGGGSGGGAGSGAGGGAGGPSIAVYESGSTVSIHAGVSLTRASTAASGGAGGQPGAAGSGGNGGNNGSSAGGTRAAGQAGSAGIVCRHHNGASCVQS